MSDNMVAVREVHVQHGMNASDNYDVVQYAAHTGYRYQAFRRGYAIGPLKYSRPLEMSIFGDLRFFRDRTK